MGNYAVRRHGATLTCLGIGSCIAVMLLDSVNKVYGMAHIMLPYKKPSFKTVNPNKFADVCIPKTLDAMLELGADKGFIKAKIAGGAHMFPSLVNDKIAINQRNTTAVKTVLHNLNIPIIAEDLGGNHGRTVFLDTDTERVTIQIKSLGVLREL